MRVVALLFSVVVLAFGVYLAVRPRPVNEAAGEEAIRRLGKLTPGMAEQDVFRTLGLQGCGLKVDPMGSGPRSAWPNRYHFTKDRAVLIRWNLDRTPPTFVSATVEQFARKG